MRFQDIRLSKHFVLLDFMQDRDLYTGKRPVLLEHTTSDELAMGVQLCRQLLEPMIELFGPCSVAAGYCPEGIGHYQTSPHSWRPAVGAGVDVAFHDWVNLDKAPIKLIEELAKYDIPFERLITYAGSEYICTSWKAKPRYALYENVRFTDGRKPNNISYSGNPTRWAKMSKVFEDRPDWRRGPNEPVFHTMRQLRPQHVRLSRYFTFLDFCRSEQAMGIGHNWVAPIGSAKQAFYGRMMGEVLDPIVQEHGRISVTQGMTPNHIIKDFKLDERFRWVLSEAMIKFLLPEGVEDIEPAQHPSVVSWEEEWHDSGAMEVTMVIKEFTPKTIYSGGFPFGFYSGEPPAYLPARVRARLAKERNG